MIAVMLVVVTGVEIATSYIDTGHSNLIIVALFVMASVKFFLVAAWYMHMKTDQPFFRRVFIVGMVGATHRLRHPPAHVLEHGAEVVGPRDRRRLPSRLAAAPRCVVADRAVRRRLRRRDQPVGSPPRARRATDRRRASRSARSPPVCSRCGLHPTGRSTTSPSAISSRCTWSSTSRYSIIAAPLLLIGTPAWLARWLLSPRWLLAGVRWASRLDPGDDPVQPRGDRHAYARRGERRARARDPALRDPRLDLPLVDHRVDAAAEPVAGGAAAPAARPDAVPVPAVDRADDSGVVPDVRRAPAVLVLRRRFRACGISPRYRTCRSQVSS